MEPGERASLPFAPYFASSLPLSMPAEEVIDRYQAHLEATRYFGDGWPKWWPDFGPGIIAGYLGARVIPVPDETVWFEPGGPSSIEELRLAHDPDNIWWRRVRELTRVAVARWGDRVTVGHTDLGGNLDILAHLRTTHQLLLDLCDAPDEVARLAGEITRLWLAYYADLNGIIAQGGRGTTNWARVWSPKRTYMLQCDFSYMISPAMFERFVMPDLEACCARLDHSFYHLDGEGQLSHLDLLLALEPLAGIQWVPSHGWRDPKTYLPILKRIRDGGKLCQPWGVTPEAACVIVRALGGRGFLFDFSHNIPPGEAPDFLAALAADHD